MPQYTDATTPRKVRRIFYLTTIGLLLGAIVVTIAQKRREHAITVIAVTEVDVGAEAIDEHRNKMERAIQDAGRWGMLSRAVVSLSILSWGVAIWRSEKHRWVSACAVVLLGLYVLLQMTMV